MYVGCSASSLSHSCILCTFVALQCIAAVLVSARVSCPKPVNTEAMPYLVIACLADTKKESKNNCTQHVGALSIQHSTTILQYVKRPLCTSDNKWAGASNGCTKRLSTMRRLCITANCRQVAQSDSRHTDCKMMLCHRP